MRLSKETTERKALLTLPEDPALTTEAAANSRGMSRQFLVNLLEKGEIIHRRVGTHRHVTFKDLLECGKKRDRTRREAMDRLADEVIKAGRYVPGAGAMRADLEVVLTARCLLRHSRRLGVGGCDG